MKLRDMKVICAAKNCIYSSDNEDKMQVMFINFPNTDASKIWAHQCGRSDLFAKSNEELHLNYYICSHHIEDRYYISKTDRIVIDEQAIPTLFETNTIAQKDIRNVCNKNERTEIGDNVILSYCDMDVEIDHYRSVGISFSNICRICRETAINGIEIFAPRGIELELKEKISVYLPINVDVNDLLPKKLCFTCYNKLEIVHSLVSASLKTDMRFKKLLNLNEEISYGYKYNVIAKECSLKLGEEICTNEIQVTPSELVSNIVEGVSGSQEIKYINSAKSSCLKENSIKETQPTLTKIVDPRNKVNGEHESESNAIKNDLRNEKIDLGTKIQCLYCKDIFKTQEIFDNHKILCNKENAVEKEEKGTRNSVNIKEPNNLEQVNFSTRTCKSCQGNFETEELLLEHKLAHCKYVEEQHSRMCDTLSTKENEHSIEYNSIPLMEMSMKCGHCDMVYNTKKELLNHIMEHHESQFLFKCIVCDKCFERWSSLDIHEATHRTDKPYLCDLCGKSFKHSNNLRGHKRIHLDESKKKRHICEICGNAFRSRFHLGEHMNQHNGYRPYSCDKCAKTFYKRIQLRQHKLSHGLNKYICPICGVAFNRKGNMNTHLKRHNNNDCTYTCSICAQRCQTMSELKLHRKTHTEQDILDSVQKKYTDRSQWQCQDCDRIFSTRAALLNHKRIHKHGRTNVECDICGKKLASKSSLTYHKKSIHYSERSHLCQYCGESFVSKETRLIHERVHTGERPYICKICNMEYKCSSNLSQHLKIHSGIKPYKCTCCNKSFTRKGALNVHERTHTGEKPYACETCNRTFSQKNDMIKHTRTHDAKSLRCEQCGVVFAKRKDILKHITLHEQYGLMAEAYVEIEQQVESCNADVPCPQF